MTAFEVIEFEREDYRNVCDELRQVIQLRKEAEAKEKELKRKVAIMAGGDRMEYGIKVKWSQRKGRIDFDKLCMAHDIGEMEKDLYRKETEFYWDIRPY